jgi:hypothetical protein
VEVAVDGVDGLHRAREFDYDTMILDVLLPGLTGVGPADGRRGTAEPAGFRAPGADISQLGVNTMSMLATAGIDGILVTRVSVRGQDGRASYASGYVGPGPPRT